MTTSVPTATGTEHTPLGKLLLHSVTWPLQRPPGLLGLMPTIHSQQPTHRREIWMAALVALFSVHGDLGTGMLCLFLVAENFVLLNAVTFCITYGEF